MLPIEQAHYTAWAQRLEGGLALAYPRTLWLVLDPDDAIWLPVRIEDKQPFHLVAMTRDGGRCVRGNVPFTLVVDEETFPLVVVALGRELERRLAAMVEEG